MNTSIKAVAFDIDGTLYPTWRLYLKVAPYFLKNIGFFLKYNKVRNILHRTAPLPDFFEYQARLLGEFLHISPAEARNQIDEKVYHGLCQFFNNLKPFPFVEETFKEFHEKGIRLAILSDFPPRQKGDIWGLIHYCDVVMGSEECGALKPSVYTFGMLAKSMELPPESILYVGNSLFADIKGAKAAGMKTAYLIPFIRSIFGRKAKEADISFTNYRQLQKYVLE